MAVYMCKMCGAPLEIEEEMTICECAYCGTSQTLPKIGDEKRVAAINRANHFRQSGDFDRAEELYEELIAQAKPADLYGNAENTEDGSAAEALAEIRQMDADLFWSLTLCRYGIEYVTDPATQKKIPTCHRLQYKNILDDDDYRRAVSFADLAQKDVIMAEARYISNVQKRILEISKQEDPYDVFICYKETDEQGARTKDSVLAQDLYYQLVREGYKTFFARVTLEGKLGTEYEPYIFAALHSAKTMIVIGTKKEHFEAPWVKNEWMRYLALMREDRSRRLIPAYQGMDPYDLPDALATFQAQDMSKLGFMQDILKSIAQAGQEEREKKGAKRETLVVSDVTETTPLLRRIGYFLEDGDFDRAAEYCDRVLNIEPECAQAYVYKLMIEKNARSYEELDRVLDHDGVAAEDSYKKAVRFADPKLKEKLKRLDQQVIYNDAKEKMTQDHDLETIREAIHEFATIPGFKDADQKKEEAIEAFARSSVEILANIDRDLENLEKKEDYQTGLRYLNLAERYDYLQKIRVPSEMKPEDRAEFLERSVRSGEMATECRFQAAVINMQIAETPVGKIEAANKVMEFGDYNGARTRAEKGIKEAREALYKEAMNIKKNARNSEDLNLAADTFDLIADYEDAQKMAYICRNKADTKDFLHGVWPLILILVGVAGMAVCYMLYMNHSNSDQDVYEIVGILFGVLGFIGLVTALIRWWLSAAKNQ